MQRLCAAPAACLLRMQRLACAFAAVGYPGGQCWALLLRLCRLLNASAARLPHLATCLCLPALITPMPRGRTATTAAG